MDMLGVIKSVGSLWGLYPAWIRVLVVVTLIVLFVWYPSATRKQEAAAKDIRIEFELKPNSPYFNLNPAGTDATGKPLRVYRLRIKIRNNSPAFTARNTSMMLMEVLHEKEGQYVREKGFEPLPLARDWNYPRDINPKAEVYAPFGEVGNPAYQAAAAANLSGEPGQPHFRFTVFPAWPPRMTSHVDPGKHRFTLAINLDGEPPRAQQFALEWSGRWADDEDSMLKKIKVKKID